MNGFENLCNGCGACTDACPFLAGSGTPDRILRERPETAFYCTSCRRCDGVCPRGLSPSAAFFETKQRLVRQEAIPPPVRKCLCGARGVAKAGHRSPLSFYPNADTAFWPGCSLAANRPGVVRRVRRILSRRLSKPVGLVLDCCFDPVYGLGDPETAGAALQTIGKRLRKHGIRQVITGCLNCHKLLSAHLEGIRVLFVLEVLPPEVFEKKVTGPLYLHHPCPTLHREEIRRKAGEAAGYIQASPQEIPEASSARCCGNGGGLSALSGEMADRFLDRITEAAASRTIITYCIGCQNRFLKQGAEAVHLLECLPGVKARRRIASPLRQWANRFSLAMTERLKTGRPWVGLVIVLMIAGGVYLNQQDLFSAAGLVNFLDRFPVLAPLAFLGIYAIAPALFLPSIPLTLAAGFFWGPVWGVVFSISGATIGACPPFFLARHLLQDMVRARVSPERWGWLQGRVVRHGWKAVAFTRLVPVFPFNLLNYLFGLTPIPFRQYLGGTFVFMLPACIAFVAFGSSLSELIVRGNIPGVIIGVAVAVLAFLLPIVLRPFFRRIGDHKAIHENMRNRSGDE